MILRSPPRPRPSTRELLDRLERELGWRHSRLRRRRRRAYDACLHLIVWREYVLGYRRPNHPNG